MASGARTRASGTASRALRGIPSNLAVSGSCTTTNPPAWRMSRTPRDPSLPVPDRMTATARSPASWATDRRKWSIGRATSWSRSLSVSSSRPPRTIMSLRGGIR